MLFSLSIACQSEGANETSLSEQETDSVHRIPAPGRTFPKALRGQACAGYTLMGAPENDAGAGATATLVDMEGELVHEYSISGFPPKMLPGGAVIGCTGVDSLSYSCVHMQQRSWSDRVEWSFAGWVDTAGGSSARHHHDFQREGNPVGFYAPGQDFVTRGNTLVLAHSRQLVPEIRDGELEDDAIYEVDWQGRRTGFVWHAFEHLDELGFDDAARRHLRDDQSEVVEWLHGNSISLLGPNKWFDAGYTEFAPDNIIYSSRNANLILIIERATGDVVWRMGPVYSGRPEEALGQISGQHHPYMIPRDLPGEGNILVFDNGAYTGWGGSAYNPTGPRFGRGRSRVVEFDPVTFDIVWEYGMDDGDEVFYTPFLGSAQRLPNGNTLINEGVLGRVIEVTPEHEIVWSFDKISDGSPRGSWIYRAYRVPPEWLPDGVNETHGGYHAWEDLFER